MQRGVGMLPCTRFYVLQTEHGYIKPLGVSRRMFNYMDKMEINWPNAEEFDLDKLYDKKAMKKWILEEVIGLERMEKLRQADEGCAPGRQLVPWDDDMKVQISPSTHSFEFVNYSYGSRPSFNLGKVPDHVRRFGNIALPDHLIPEKARNMKSARDLLVDATKLVHDACYNGEYGLYKLTPTQAMEVWPQGIDLIPPKFKPGRLKRASWPEEDKEIAKKWREVFQNVGVLNQALLLVKLRAGKVTA